MKKNIYNAFSLMEMMVVLLIVAIVAAATAPMVTKKMSRNAGSGDSPWVFTGLGGNIAYNMGGNDNTTVMIGTSSLPNGWGGITRLFIDSGNNASHIAFGNGNQTPLLLTADPAGRVGFSNAQIPSNSVAFGTSQTLGTRSKIIAIGDGANVNSSLGESIAIGYESYATGNEAIAIGTRVRSDSDNMNRTQATSTGTIAIGTAARSFGDYSIAIGSAHFRNNRNVTALANTDRAIAIGAGAQAFGRYAVAIGSHINSANSPKTQAYGQGSVAIGTHAVSGKNSDTATTDRHAIAIGYSATASGQNSVAIGHDATASVDDQIVLGSPSSTVYIPGNLVVGKRTALGMSDNVKSLYLRTTQDGFSKLIDGYITDKRSNGIGFWYDGGKYSYPSDRRLKNVGEKYTAGLDELKKLDFYHYTFKKDEKKTPKVGVMAQDLQKVFPDAVTKGDDGYLRIRLEDMFYAVINAVKELDNKVSEIVANISGINSKIESLEKENSELQKENSELKTEIKNIEKRIEKLESSKH